MKEVFSKEVAEHLGYQKYWPEKSDWLLATGRVLLILFVICGISFSIMNVTRYAQREDKKIETQRAAISEWCKTTPVKNLAETKECLYY